MKRSLFGVAAAAILGAALLLFAAGCAPYPGYYYGGYYGTPYGTYYGSQYGYYDDYNSGPGGLILDFGFGHGGFGHGFDHGYRHGHDRDHDHDRD